MRAEGGRDARLIASLAAGADYKRAAQESGYGVRTIGRRMADPQFASQVREARRRLLDDALGELSTTARDAARTLRLLLNAKSEQVRYMAARAVIDVLMRHRADNEIDERIAELERLAAEYGDRR